MAPTHDPHAAADPAPTLSAHVRVDAAGPLGGVVVATLAWWRCDGAPLLDGPAAMEFVLEEGRAELVWRPFAHPKGEGRGVLVVVDPGPPARVVLEQRTGSNSRPTSSTPCPTWTIPMVWGSSETSAHIPPAFLAPPSAGPFPFEASISLPRPARARGSGPARSSRSRSRPPARGT